MQKSIFGTDGIRGLANDGYITPCNMINLAKSVSKYFHKIYDHQLKIIIGKDTRISCYMLESALTAGFVSCNDNVVLLGPMPTPSISFLTKSLRADIGVMISASHNPYHDNGVKFFGANGFKISTKDEIEISNIFLNNLHDNIDHKTTNVGSVKRLDDVAGRYIEFCKNSFPKNMTLNGVRMVLDTANGSTYKIAPQVFWELGADVLLINASPNGYNINASCGATDLKELQRTVVSKRADIGIALDGDGDRIIVVDENGSIIDGDYIIATIAKYWMQLGIMKTNNVVATMMSNMQLSNYLKSCGIELHMCDVGDKYVASKMLEIGAIIGGEKSGHIIPIEYTSTGDGIIAALQILSYLVSNNKKTSDISKIYKPFPQKFINIQQLLSEDQIQDMHNKIQKINIRQPHRIVIRKSGTEPITRIMIEGEHDAVISTLTHAINDLINEM